MSTPAIVVNPKALLIAEAEKYLGTREQGHNGGPIVEMFQKCVDGRAEGEPWCMAFAQFCLREVEKQAKVTANIFHSEHCLTVFNRTAPGFHRLYPGPGLLVIWRHGNTMAGHTGIVTRVIDAEHFETIEGNTGPDNDTVQREGSGADGVYRKVRHTHPVGEMHIVGFLDPFPEAQL